MLIHRLARAMTQSVVFVVLTSLYLTLGVKGLRQQKDMHKHGDLESGLGMRNLTDLFSNSDQGPKYAVLADGNRYLCCCSAESVGEISCKLKDVETDYVHWWRTGCGGYMGYHWHSWYNVIKYAPNLILLPNVGSCMVPEDELPDVLTTTTTTTPAPTVIDFGADQYKLIDGQWNKCCCRSDIQSKPEESTKIVCDLAPVPNSTTPQLSGAGHMLYDSGVYGPGHKWVGCKQLRGPGYHSWNNMGRKYEELEHFNECVIHPV
mmetsp:Transcript_81074/g.164204  ORF Transcript_81074/g.164204 Transcript_81074/m.164204 type:complete len:262 (-) Transcript_81074:52-837(-)